jgi:hypothetical protein
MEILVCSYTGTNVCIGPAELLGEKHLTLYVCKISTELKRIIYFLGSILQGV